MTECLCFAAVRADYHRWMITVMRPLLLRAALSLAALAAPYPAAAQSEPTVKIEHDEARDATVIHAAIDIDAKPAAVWAVITDCDRAPKYVPNMESCRIVEREANGRWQLRETVHNVMLLPRIRSVSRLEFENGRRMTFKSAGGDMRVAEGQWKLEPLDKGKATRLRYDAVLALNFSVPRFMINQAASRDVPSLMKAIARESLAEAAQR
jgi:carbon monoxide dehydrogenase subunit G